MKRSGDAVCALRNGSDVEGLGSFDFRSNREVETRCLGLTVKESPLIYLFTNY